jgi:hypothetical protein
MQFHYPSLAIAIAIQLFAIVVVCIVSRIQNMLFFLIDPQGITPKQFQIYISNAYVSKHVQAYIYISRKTHVYKRASIRIYASTYVR